MGAKFFLESPIKARRASQIIRRAVSTGAGIVSFQVVQEFFNVALKRFARPLTTAEAGYSCAAAIAWHGTIR